MHQSSRRLQIRTCLTTTSNTNQQFTFHDLQTSTNLYAKLEHKPNLLKGKNLEGMLFVQLNKCLEDCSQRRKRQAVKSKARWQKREQFLETRGCESLNSRELGCSHNRRRSHWKLESINFYCLAVYSQILISYVFRTFKFNGECFYLFKFTLGGVWINIKCI